MIFSSQSQGMNRTAIILVVIIQLATIRLLTASVIEWNLLSEK